MIILMVDTSLQQFLNPQILKLYSLAEQVDYQITWNRMLTSYRVYAQQDGARRISIQLEPERLKLSGVPEVMNAAFVLIMRSDPQVARGRASHVSKGLTRTLWVLMQWKQLLIVQEMLQGITTRTTSSRSCHRPLQNPRVKNGTKCRILAKPTKMHQPLRLYL